MIMHPVNLGVGVPGMGGTGGAPGITGTDDASLPAALVESAVRGTDDSQNRWY